MNVLLAALVAFAIVALFSGLLWRRIRNHRRFHDARSHRELVMSIALWLVAACGAMSALFSIAMFGPIELRRMLGGVAWSALLAYGVIAVQDSKSRGER